MAAGTLRMLAANSRRAVDEGVYDVGERLESRGGLDSALRGRRGAAIISEVKFASPSRGVIRGASDPGAVASEMAAGGAAAISVLTQPHLFGGSPENLVRVRRSVDVPVLMKDVVVDPVQVDAAGRMGADCLLLIQAVFDAGYARDMDGMVDRAHGLGVQVLLEVHDRAELASALSTECDIVGVNNRNLDTLEVSLDATRETLRGYSDPRIAVSESGISSPAHVRYLSGCGAGAFLVGSGIMGRGNIKDAVAGLVNSL